jgi:hypothetical protein
VSRSVLLIVFLAIQLSIGLTAADFRLGGLIDRFTFLDSKWYIHIAANGYTQPSWNSDPGSQFAFFPLWPYTIRFAHLATGLSLPIVGTLLSFSCFVIGLGMLRRGFVGGVGGYPVTAAGWFALIFAPGSWVFFSNHTEGMFFFLSICTLWRASRLDWLGAALFAGAAALTRNQGFILIIAVAAGHWISNRATPSRSRWLWPAGFAATALAIASIWPAYEWALTGNAFAHVDAQKYWQVSFSASRYIRNALWFSASNFPKSIIFWAGIATSVYLFFRRPEFRALSLYVLGSVLVLPLQGHNFPQAYRFSAVLFPVWFVVGDFLFRMMSLAPGQNASQFIKAAALTVFILWHARVCSYYFFQFNWPY